MISSGPCLSSLTHPKCASSRWQLIRSFRARLSAILDLPEARARIALLSVDAYEALAEKGLVEKRAELIRGIIVKKMPKSPLHRKLNRRIYGGFHGQLGTGFVVFQGCPFRLVDSMPEPDVMIARGEEGGYDTQHPTTAELVVEVAVSSAALDRENASLCAEAGVPEYWIVLGNEREIEVYRQPENGVYQQKRLYAVGETLACASVPGLQAVLADWFA